ncbi:hypothetical protein DFH08DRAFT_906622 [Mycena albidolilacea]|uniref:F-box domain-containing protein n=1 Tax=Mycena albidolilacea TaxID=1033008 RepID=A0AAD7E800_9AGAR|nr:hypothetical protein DFH08DRAFT_906622 [Mycena albidolilacea]
MSTSHSCDSLCSLHYASETTTGLLVSPFSDLLSTSVSPPSDSQIQEICSEIERAESTISDTDTHLARLQGAMDKLLRHRAELVDFVKSHRAVISPLRRLPSEILLEIFEHCRLDHLTFLTAGPHRNMLWIISQVCSRWRTVALNSPMLWRRFVLRDWLSNIHHHDLMRLSAMQLARARCVPLSLDLTFDDLVVDTLALFLAVSAQWEDVELILCPRGFRHFFNHSGTFAALKRLTMSSWNPLPDTHDVDWRESFTALEHLTLKLFNEPFPRRLLLPWAQLRTCALKNVDSFEVLWIASQLSPGTAVSTFEGMDIANGGDVRSTSQTRSLISSLTLTKCGEAFVSNLLNSLVAPAIETLVLEGIITRDIIHFLRQSACTLKCLRIDTPISEEHLIPLLESPHTHSIIHLDLSGTPTSTRGIASLAAHSQLRTLVLQGGSEDHEPLLTTLAHHRPVVQSGFSEPFPHKSRIHCCLQGMSN